MEFWLICRTGRPVRSGHHRFRHGLGWRFTFCLSRSRSAEESLFEGINRYGDDAFVKISQPPCSWGWTYPSEDHPPNFRNPRGAPGLTSAEEAGQWKVVPFNFRMNSCPSVICTSSTVLLRRYLLLLRYGMSRMWSVHEKLLLKLIHLLRCSDFACWVCFFFSASERGEMW